MMMMMMLLQVLLLAFLASTARAFTTSSTACSSSNSHVASSSLRMFTGIVEEMGTVVSLEERDDMPLWDGTQGKGTELVVKGDVVMKDAYLGCSICVSGVCLTATELDTDKQQFKVGLAPETLKRTYLSDLKPGQPVNLERASEIGGRNSGHFVQGHVDTTGTILERTPDNDSLWFKIKVDDPELIRYIVPKGFIAIDGTSLTVVDVNTAEQWFTLMLVEYTQKKIIIPAKDIDDKVNIEVDVLGKYSETAMAALIPRIEALEARVESLEKQQQQQASKA
ncbi:Riboflavin synthase [Seminavis robusta]|uniref:Riboflavin synthase n=1 Tax=Seminavis robusta TaxID=568900 RepID=A0A9N8DEZ1_9STRA|nr:Riboflavin synthase [Seminavis robusta]|eukprot:Sro85_g045410.1 Riboflavin synthase (280) ;mRNA; r:75807-76917